MKKYISLILSMAIIFSSFGVFAFEYVGTKDNPVLISDKWDLLKFADDINGEVSGGEGLYYKLANDIDLGGMNWSIYIGTDVNPFRGTFDGNGKVISNFRIAVESYVVSGDNGEDYYGLFGAMAGDAKVCNLGIENIQIFSSANVWNEVAGGIVGIMYDNAKIDSCYVKNFEFFDDISPEIAGSGPIAGKLDGDGVEITNCYSLNVKYPSGSVDYEAGIAGRSENFKKIENCYSTHTIARAPVNSGDKIINSYYSTSAPWPWESGDGNTKYFGTKITDDQLKQNLSNIGDAFKDGGVANGGYPALLWEDLVETSLGSGTQDDPKLISSVDDLIAAAKEINIDGAEGVYYKLTQDIDFEGADWTNYIGTFTVPFKGVFDGDGHIIKNAKMPDDGKTYVGYGIFGCVGGNGIVKNVGVENIEIYKAYTGIQYSKSAFGGLVGKLVDNAKVDSCYAKNIKAQTKTVDATAWSGFNGDQLSYAAGLVGFTEGSGVEITNCYAVNFEEINDSASNNSVMIAYMAEGTFAKVENCYAVGSLAQCVANDKSKVINCYATDTTSWSSLGTRPGILVTEAQLKTKATDLGNAFKENNGGYPILVWETEQNVNVSGGDISSVEMDGTGTKDDPYVIQCAGNLIAASQIADTNEKYFVLANDIDLGGNKLPAVIGSSANEFKGNFNGKGHIIKNFEIDVNADGDFGIFGVVGSNANVSYFGVEGVNIVLSSTGAWNTRAGGIAGYVKDNAKASNIFAKNVKFSATYVRENQAELRFGGGLFGEINGDGVEIKNCYSVGYEEIYTEGKAIVNNDGGFAGAGLNFKAVENCYSDTSLMRHIAGLNVVNCYEKANSIEWPQGYDWGAYNSHPNALNYEFSNEFVPVMGGSPKLKWELYDDMYVNLVSGGTNENVTLEKDGVYRVSFRAETVSGNNVEFIWKLGDIDLTENLINSTIGELAPKAVYVKVEEDGVYNFLLSCDEEINVYDIEIVKVDPETELTGIHQNFYHKAPRNPVVDFDLLVPQYVYDGVEVQYSGNYISQNGELDAPIGFGVSTEIYSAKVGVADMYFEKNMILQVKEKTPVEVRKVTLTDGEKEVYGMAYATTVSKVEIVKNQDADAQMFVALYSGDTLKAIKKVLLTDEVEYETNMTLNGADKYKIFIYEDGTLMPVAVADKSYPTLNGEVVTIHPTGDSLCETYAPENERTGWGQVIGDYFADGKVIVDNTLSRSGMSTIEYVEMGRLNKLMNKLLPDEYVLIQLGTNDQWVATVPQYINYLTQMVSVVRAKGAIPVFINPPDFLTAATNTKDGDKYVVNSMLEGYPDIMRELAIELNVPMIDVNQKTLDYFAEKGHSGAVADEYYLTDNVHFNEKGANWIAGMVAEGLVELGLPLADYLK